MMTKYRVRAHSWSAHFNNYFKVQQWSWLGWKTVAEDLHTAEEAAQIIRDLLKVEKEFEGEDDD